MKEKICANEIQIGAIAKRRKTYITFKNLVHCLLIFVINLEVLTKVMNNKESCD